MFGQRKIISTQMAFPAANFAKSEQHEPDEINAKPTIIANFKFQKTSQQTTQIPLPHSLQQPSARHQSVNVAIAPMVGFTTAKATISIGSYNLQLDNYTSTITTEQSRLTQNNFDFLSKVYASDKALTATNLRNKSDWGAVKNLVTRQELMKIQMGGKTSLPLTDAQYAEVVQKLNGIDLSNMSDVAANAIIGDILRPSKQMYLNALKDFKSSGTANELFQTSKLERLHEHLQSVDLENITAKEFKFIEDNFIEKTEIHHRTSISSNPTVQSEINNLDTLNTSQHNAKHTNPDTGKIDYSRKLDENSIDRLQELKRTNSKRVVIKALQGVGLAAAIGLGTGFAIGFVVNLAQNGLNPASLRYAFASGIQQGGRSAVMGAGSAAIGIAAHKVTESLAKHIASQLYTNAAEETAKNIATMCNMGVVGSLTIIVFSVYEFAKLKQSGYTTKECLLRTGQSAALSFSVLIISIAAQGIWGGYAGLVVSLTAGIIMVGYSISQQRHNKKIAKEIAYYSIELCRPAIEAC